MSRTVASRCEYPPHGNIVLIAKVLRHRGSAVCAKFLIELFATRTGGITRNLDHVSFEALGSGGNRVESRFGVVVQSRPVTRKIDSSFDHCFVAVQVRHALIDHPDGSGVHDGHIAGCYRRLASLIRGGLSLVRRGLGLVRRGLSLARCGYAL